MKRCLVMLICILVLMFTVMVLSSCKNDSDGATADSVATMDEQEPLPWENGGKQPEKYSYEEFEALSPVLQEAFVESFESVQAFEEWEKKSGYSATQEVEIPWENGGKKPEKYTIEEFEALSGPQQEAFAESFDSVDAFEQWEAEASKK